MLRLIALVVAAALSGAPTQPNAVALHATPSGGASGILIGFTEGLLGPLKGEIRGPLTR